MSATVVIVDFQGFRGNANEFIVKELCILKRRSGEDEEIDQYLFRPPYEHRRLNKRRRNEAVWVEHNHHGLRWNDGTVNYSELYEILDTVLDSTSATIYVKGEEKKKILADRRSNRFNIVDVEDYGCSTLKQLKKERKDQLEHCCYHDPIKYTCALNNVILIDTWLTDFIREKGKSKIASTLTLLRQTVETIINNLQDAEGEERCTLHYEWRGKLDGDDWDGPNPKIKNCIHCIAAAKE
jgi:hypothetical protein